MDLHLRVTNVLNCLRENNLTIPIFLRHILQGQNKHAQEEITFNAADMCSDLYSHAADVVFPWALGIVKSMLCKEMEVLTHENTGLHFRAAKAGSEYLEGSFMQKAAEKIQQAAPKLWDLVYTLLDAKAHSRRRAFHEGTSNVGSALGSAEEGDLGEIGGDEDGAGEDGAEEEPAGPKASKRFRRAASRNEALLVIKSVVTISIFAQSTNERCNYLQGILGMFYHSTSVPEKVIETLAHAGLSISLTSIHNAVKSLSKEAAAKIKTAIRSMKAALAYDNFDINFKTAEPTVEHTSTFVSATSATTIPLFGVDNPEVLRCSAELWEKDPRNPSPSANPIKLDTNDLLGFHRQSSTIKKLPSEKFSPLLANFAWHVRDILVRRGGSFGHLASHLGQPASINQIPLHKTTQIPCRAMHVKESTPDGNIEVMECLLWQGGIGEPESKDFNPDNDIDMSEWVIIVHGDLLTKERLDAVRESRRIEATPKRRFQYIIFLPGLFHFKMACADALWRTWVQPQETHSDVNSMYQHVGILRPDETGKFSSKPGFRQIHDVIHHDLWASMLDCWRVEAKKRNASWMTLDEFAKSKPTWDLIVEMSESIVTTYVATTPSLSAARRKPAAERDRRFENQILRNRDELLYVELSHAMNAGDIGRVEGTFLPWIYIFKATGKHKYASQMLRFMVNMRDLYKPDLQHLIRMNWLCNPTGKPHGFRGVDWLVERNNLYTKVIYGGSGSNRTIAHIIKESPLIELYRECHVTVENGFHLEHRTIRHAHPDMTNTISQLRTEIEKHSPHLFTRGRRADYSVQDQIAAAMDTTQKQGITVENNDESQEVTGDDLF